MKLVCLLVVSILPCIISFFNLHKQKLCIKSLKYFENFFRQLELLLKNAPLEAVSLLENIVGLSDSNNFSNLILNELNKGCSFFDAWCHSFCSVADFKYLSDAEKSELNMFAITFGKGDTEDQIRLCRIQCEYCKECFLNRKNSFEKNKQTYLSIAFLCSILIFITFY